MSCNPAQRKIIQKLAPFQVAIATMCGICKPANSASGFNQDQALWCNIQKAKAAFDQAQSVEEDSCATERLVYIFGPSPCLPFRREDLPGRSLRQPAFR
jgi:hypothetical protein